MPASLSRAPRLFARALRLKCPNCGRGSLFTSWLRMRSHCPFVFFPFSKTLFLVFDLLFRPDAREAR